jgi:hypothetical protein
MGAHHSASEQKYSNQSRVDMTGMMREIAPNGTAYRAETKKKTSSLTKPPVEAGLQQRVLTI